MSNVVGNVCMAHGHQYMLVLVSLTKRQLNEKMPASCRLEFLEHLDRMPCDSIWLTDEMVAAVQPMDDRGLEIVHEAMKLGPNQALDVYAKNFSTFAKLNPSLLTVLALSPVYQRSLENV